MDNTLEKGAFKSKDFDLVSLEIMNSVGQTIDIRNVFVELQIFQDIYSSVMNGSILINDANDLFESFAFCGNEYIKVVIDKPSLDIPLEKTFRIYKSSDRRPAKNSAQVYTLHFCSDELIRSNGMKVSKAYGESYAGLIVYDILSKFLKVPDEKIFALDKTGMVSKVIVPNYRPFEAIQWIAGRTFDTDNQSCYLFFESTFGFKFVSLASLYGQKPYKKLRYELKAINSEPANDKDSIDSFKIISDFDVITSATNGGHLSKLIAVDPLNQTFTKHTYSLSQDKLLNKNYSSNLFSPEDSFTLTNISNDNKIDKWLIPRGMRLSAMNNFRISVVLPGDILLNVGDVIDYEFPKFASADETGRQLDRFRSGKYLVTAINHKFSEDKFESIVELSSDSLASALPTATITKLEI